jgi:hypothetical protein
MRISLVLLAVGRLALTPTQEPVVHIPHRLPIVDEAWKEPALKEVRDGLLRAAKSGQLADVWAFVDPDLQVTYDSGQGIEQLKREWEIEGSPKRFLDELVSVLSLGGRFEGAKKESFIAPSFFIDHPDVSSMGAHGVVIRKKASVYARPKTSAPISATVLAGDVLPMLLAFKGWIRGWVQVTLQGGRRSYMLETD